MKRSIALYGLLAFLLEVWLARAVQLIGPGFMNMYRGIYGDPPLLPEITEIVLKYNGTLYIPPVAMVIGYALGLLKGKDQVPQHALFWGLISFLALLAMHAVALFLPLIVTIGKIQ